ncbi:MAG TPA: pantoate--beta-alanine ligase, partial [Ktedonobacterales bacterium]|nr:pantoate--beta-alanine ligase [Ktedonobacterales bacterium]
LPVEIVVGSIIRESDGLAMSSRNVYLQPDERRVATVLQRALVAGRDAIENGETNGDAVRNIMRATIGTETLAQLDYTDVVHPDTFVALDTIQPPALLALVARVGKPRLLDNYLWRTDGSWDVGRTI